MVMSINSPLLCSGKISVRLNPTYSLFCVVYFDVKTGGTNAHKSPVLRFETYSESLYRQRKISEQRGDIRHPRCCVWCKRIRISEYQSYHCEHHDGVCGIE